MNACISALKLQYLETICAHQFLQVNVVRGVIAAICCAVFFIGIALVHKFRWRPPSRGEDSIKLEEVRRRQKQMQGAENHAMDISDTKDK